MRTLTLVTGASGFMGFHVVRALLRAEIPCRAMVRRTSDDRALRGLGAELVTGDITRPETLGPALAGCRVVINLAGAADVADPALNEQVNVQGTANVARACAEAGVPRLLHFSSSCAVRAKQDAYGRTKREGERALQGCGLDLRIFRPAMMYGEGSKEWTTFVSTVARLPLVPVPGRGEHLLRPVLVDDAVQATLAAATRDGLDGRVYDIVGADSLTLNALVREVARRVGKRRRPLHLPLPLVLGGAHLLGKLVAHPPVVPDQVLAFDQDTTGDPGPASADLGFAPRPMAEGLDTLFARTPWRRMGELR